jgi:competence protein ComEC
MGFHIPRYLRKALLLVVIALVALVPGLVDRFGLSANQGDGSTLTVTFFDIGQGDSIYIETPSGRQVLIDGGPDGTVLRKLAHEMGYWDRTLDMVIATHEDKDHVGGLPGVFDRYRIGTFVRTENQGESTEARVIDELSKREESDIVYARRGMTFDLGRGTAGSTTLTILFPERDPSMLESNTSSIVARLVYGEAEFLLTGDSPDEIEEHLVYLDAPGLQSDVLKLGHHGSRTSSSETFLRAVSPEYAIVSAGKDNRYGHPHTEVVERLARLEIPMLNTATEGDITFTSDGATLRRD